MPHGVRFRKGHGPIPTADIFPFGITSAWCSFSERAWPYPYGGHFPVRHNIRMVYVFGKGMALSLRADIFPFGKT